MATKKAGVEPKGLYPYLNADGSLTDLALKQLKNPFDPSEVTFKPTDIKDNKGLALAYADKRTYEARLDEVFGPQNWSPSVVAFTAPYRKVRKARYNKYNDPSSGIKTPEEIIEGYKIFTIVTISVNGVGSKTSTSSSETDDENDIMTAEAQAFKRACSMYYIGKYFYDLPRYDVEISYGKIKEMPKLPDWAIPVKYCEDCASAIRTTEFKAKDDTVQSWNPIEIVKRSQQHFGQNLCMDCMRKRREAKTPAETNSRLKKDVVSTEAEQAAESAAA